MEEGKSDNTVSNLKDALQERKVKIAERKKVNHHHTTSSFVG